jgi:hypothetical protein
LIANVYLHNELDFALQESRVFGIQPTIAVNWRHLDAWACEERERCTKGMIMSMPMHMHKRRIITIE